MLQKILSFFLDLLFPPQCVGCKKEGFYLCDNCKSKIIIREKQVCPVCKIENESGQTHQRCKKTFALDGLLIATHYSDNYLIKKLVGKFKFSFQYVLQNDLGNLLCQVLTLNFDSKKIRNYLIVPVPLHRSRLSFRGFNQAEKLAEIITKKWQVKMERKLLLRKRKTSQQSKLQREQRLINIQDAFIINDQLLIKNPEWRRKKILLVDDIATTGATLNECAKVFKQNGFEEVWGVVIARG